MGVECASKPGSNKHATQQMASYKCFAWSAVGTAHKQHTAVTTLSFQRGCHLIMLAETDAQDMFSADGEGGA